MIYKELFHPLPVGGSSIGKGKDSSFIFYKKPTKKAVSGANAPCILASTMIINKSDIAIAKFPTPILELVLLPHLT